MPLNEKGKCPDHPHCKAWVKVAGKDICYECWNSDTRPTVVKEAELKAGNR